MQRFVTHLDQAGLASATQTLYIGYMARFHQWLVDHGHRLTPDVLTWKLVRAYARTLPLT